MGSKAWILIVRYKHYSKKYFINFKNRLLSARNKIAEANNSRKLKKLWTKWQ